MNIIVTLAQFARSQARKELKPLLLEAKKRASEHRRSIAALKREVALLRKEMNSTKSRLPAPSVIPERAEGGKFRLRIDGLKAHRKRLGLSAKDFGALMNVSGLTVYNWEQKKSKPRRSQLPQIARVRELGKREAVAMLKQITAH